MRRFVLLQTILLCVAVKAMSQSFFNLTADEVKIDSMLPCFAWSSPLSGNFADSVYTVTIDYPEFRDMSDTDIRRYRRIASDSLPNLPVVNTAITFDRKKPSLGVSFIPLVYRNGKYQKLVSFKLTVSARALPKGRRTSAAAPSLVAASERYAASSVLASGDWAKIRVASTGFYQLTDDLIRKAGFSDPSKVKVYGYGGNLQPEVLTGDYLIDTDDLKEVPTCTVNGKRIFYAVGPVSWNSQNVRVRNPYSDYGYYFLTADDQPAATVTSEELLAAHYPSAEDYNTLYEVDNYAWFTGGRNLFDSKLYSVGQANTYQVPAAGPSADGTLRVVVSGYSFSASTVSVSLNGTEVGQIVLSGISSDYVKGNMTAKSFSVNNLQATNTVTLTETSGGDVRLDNISIHTLQAKAAPDFTSASFPIPEFVHRITNQNLHADTPVDMVIIIPTSQQLLQQAERLKALHEQHDGYRVRIVPADELYNEFSSGTPDATAYRRYLKMLYDRAESEADMPRYLILFGDGAWDNRMLTSNFHTSSPDDFLLCYESENSFSEVDCFVSDDFFCLLDDGESIGTEGVSYSFKGKPDVAVGRFPVRTAAEASVMVDNVEAYLNKSKSGLWQNTVVLMGDDGNENSHMKAADAVANVVEQESPAIDVKRVMWDAYTRESSSTGFSFPEARKACLQYISNGALVLNYNGHGNPSQMSHEQVIVLNDFKNNTSPTLPLWVTASCDIMPFDGYQDNIGEQAVKQSKGGAIGFFGTTRTVYTSQNRTINMAFTYKLFSTDTQGNRLSIGEAIRQAKVMLAEGGSTPYGNFQDQSVNKLQYSYLGDPAVVLAYPQHQIVVDSINGVASAAIDGVMQLKAGSKVNVKGHIANGNGVSTDFNGMLTATVMGPKVQITCKLNNPDTSPTGAGSSVAYVYSDRQSTVFRGNDSIRSGNFDFTFVVPKDIPYSDDSGRLTFFGISNDRQKMVNGETEAFCLNGSSDFKTDSLGPSIYCYLNNSSFVNGGAVNPTPYFVAEVSDEDGINAAGGGLGHDLQLVIDGELSQTYILNDYFSYDFGSYQRGTVGYQIPTLAEGEHRLRFRAWDILNNSSTAELTFNVVRGLAPSLYDIECTRNPATTSTSFRILHDRIGSQLDVVIDIFDISGRHLWSYATSDTPTSNALDIDWNLTVDGGRRLGTGVYLYRARVSCDGSDYVSKAKKLIILNNK